MRLASRGECDDFISLDNYSKSARRTWNGDVNSFPRSDSNLTHIISFLLTNFPQWIKNFDPKILSRSFVRQILGWNINYINFFFLSSQISRRLWQTAWPTWWCWLWKDIGVGDWMCSCEQPNKNSSETPSTSKLASGVRFCSFSPSQFSWY